MQRPGHNELGCAQVALLCRWLFGRIYTKPDMADHGERIVTVPQTCSLFRCFLSSHRGVRLSVTMDRRRT